MENFPVIGICGPAKSGKDLVGDWFNEKGFVKVAFADPMKRFVRQVFQVDYETLWGSSDLREKPISYSDQQWFEMMARFNPAGNALINEVVKANKVQAYLSLTDWLNSMRRSHQVKGHITMREVLQTLGTEWGRDKVDGHLWVKHLHETVVPRLNRGGCVYQQDTGFKEQEGAKPPEGVIIPDTRFLNEVLGNRAYGAYTIRLRRLSLEKEGVQGNVGIKNHSSEVEMRDIPDDKFDRVLQLEEGTDAVYAVLEKLFEEKPWTSSSTTTPTTESSSVGA